MTTPPPIEEVDATSMRQVPQEILASPVPLKLRGLIAAWPVVERCSSIDSAAAYFSRFWSENQLTVYVGDADIDGRFFYDESFAGFNFKSGTANLPQVFQKLAQEDRPSQESTIYVGSTPVDQYLPGFREENDIQFDADDVLVNFWLGTSTRISAHFDFPDNIACVVAGRRKFTLFPPDQVSNLYVGPLQQTPSGQPISLVDMKQPDLDKFPRFEDALANAISAELEPGDALFIPSLWWHHVEAFDDFNLLVNYWWCQSPVFMGSPMPALFHAILSVRDLPERQRQAWAALFQHYVFAADEEVYQHIPEQSRGWLSPLDDTSARRLRAELINRLNR